METVSFAGRPYVFQIQGCGFAVYDASGTGVGTGTTSDPFGGSNAYGHNDYRTRQVALLNDFPYGIVSQSSEGWAVFKVNYNQSTGVISSIVGGTRFYFGDSNAPGLTDWVYGFKLFRIGSRVYVVGRWLDQASTSLRIADFGDGTTAPPLTLMSQLSPATASSLFDVIDGPGGPFLYVYGAGGTYIYNVSNPASPVYLGKNTDEGLAFTVFNGNDYGPGYPMGTALATVTTTNGTERRLYTTARDAYFYVYNVTDPANPVRLVKQAVAGGGYSGAGIASDGKLLGVQNVKTDGQPMMRLYSVSQDQVSEITHSINWSSVWDAAFRYESPYDIAIVPPTTALPTAYKVLRTTWMRGYWNTVAASCIDTTPTAGVSIARSSNTGTATCAGNPNHGTEVKGFPGDRFTVTNTSTGFPAPTVQSVVVIGVDAGNSTYTQDITASLSGINASWTAPTDLTGEFAITLTLVGVTPAAIQYVYLCNNPDPAVAVSQYMAPGGSFQTCNNCAWLQGYTLRLSAAGSEGTPTTWAWIVEQQDKGGQTWNAKVAGTDYTDNANGTIDLPLALTGTYRVTLDPDYAFTEAQPEPTAVVSLASGAITVTLQVEQPSGTVIAAGGTVMRSQNTIVRANAQCAAGATCVYTWGGAATASCPTPTGAPPFVCTIAGNTLATGATSASIAGSSTSPTDSANASASFNVSDCASPGAAVNVSPAAGASVPAGSVNLSWSAPPTGTTPFTYYVKNSLGATLCGPITSGTSCTITASGPTTWFVRTENACGFANGTSTNFTISGGCTAPNAPVNQSPSAGASVPAGNVTLSWAGSSSGTSPFTYTAKTSIGGTLCGPTSSTSCTASVSGPTTWFVQSSNNCGSANSSSTSFTVGGGCNAPSSPVLQSPGVGATVPAGSVTLSWSASSGDPTISYTAKNSLGSTLCGPTTSTSCTITANGPVTWFVQASNGCGNTNSASRSFSVSGGCNKPTAPANQTPTAGATVPLGSIYFAWVGSTGDPTISYTVKNTLGTTLCGPTTSTNCTATINSGSSVSWFVQASNSCGPTNSSSTSFSLGAACTAPGAAFLIAPANVTKIGSGDVLLQWNAPASGTPPFTYTVYLDSSPYASCQNISALSCQLTGLPLDTRTHSWKVRTNGCSSTYADGDTWTFTTCNSTAVPQANFTMAPLQDAVLAMANGYQQKQPYVGQTSTLTNTSTNGPFTDVSWYDFQGELSATIKTVDVTHTWSKQGNHNVRMNVANCFGYSAEKLTVVNVYPDTRPVIADFTIAPEQPVVGGVVTFTAKTTPDYGEPTGFTWKFDDETDVRTGNPITRTFTCSKQVSLKLIVTGRNLTSDTPTNPTNMTKMVVVGGTPQCCAATRVPQTSFDYTEKGQLSFQGMAQDQPYVGQLVHFTDLSSFAAVTSWLWEMPDGTTQSIKDATFTFATPGSYDVYLTAGNCFGIGNRLKKTITVFADVRPVTADFTCTPTSPAVGATATCTARDGFDFGDPTVFNWTFPGNVKPSGKVVTNIFGCGGANTVTLVARRGTFASNPTSKTITTTGTPSCCVTPNAANTPVPTSGSMIPGGTITLSWGRPTRGTDPLTYDVYLDGAKLAECSNLTDTVCTTTVLDGTITHVWKVIAKNECGDTTTAFTPPEWRFKACSATAKPDATIFTWSPTGPIVIKGVSQDQPYVGQTVTFSYDPSPTSPATGWLWNDRQKSPWVNFSVPHPQVVYSAPGDFTMFLRASNCMGSLDVTQRVHVYPDVRPVEARFSYSPSSPADLEPVTFTFDNSDEVGNPTEWTIDFGDGTPPQVVPSTTTLHAYGCAKLYRVTVTARRVKAGSTVASDPHTEDLGISGFPCSPQQLMVVDMVHQSTGTGGTIERGDMVVFNPTPTEMQLKVAVRDSATGQVTATLPLPPLPPQGSRDLSEIIAQTGIDFSCATLWFQRAEPGVDEVPVISAWRFVETSTGAKYGQFLPVSEVWPVSDQTSTRWLAGLVHNSLNSERLHYGFVTKLTFVDPTLTDPNRTPWGGKKVKLTLYDKATGAIIATDAVDLWDPRFTFNGYRQDYLNRFFHLSDNLDLKAVTVQVEIPAGISVVVSSSMFDNVTEHAVVFPAQTAR